MNYNQYDAFKKVLNELFVEASKQTFPHASQFIELDNSMTELVKSIKKIPQNLQMEASYYSLLVYSREMNKPLS